jgi:sulfite exporter TauE/SafE
MWPTSSLRLNNVETGYLLSLTTGFIGGFGHCIGMCGPLVASFTLTAPPVVARPALRGLFPNVLYNLGRVTTYGFIGGIMGLTGSFVNVAGRIVGLQNAVAVVAGVMMIFMGMGIAGVPGTTVRIEKYNASVVRAARRLLGSSSSLRYFPLGLLLGLLPCGLSYTVFIASAGSGGMLPGAVTALLFGIGTLPALVFFGTLITVLSASLRGTIYRLSGIFVIVMGIYFMFRGIKLYAGL